MLRFGMIGNNRIADEFAEAASGISEVSIDAIFSYCQYSSRYDAYKRGEVLNAFMQKATGYLQV